MNDTNIFLATSCKTIKRKELCRKISDSALQREKRSWVIWPFHVEWCHYANHLHVIQKDFETNSKEFFVILSKHDINWCCACIHETYICCGFVCGGSVCGGFVGGRLAFPWSEGMDWIMVSSFYIISKRKYKILL